MERDLTTEAKIMEAATRVFIAKGFNGCSSREIAREAGLNVALVNYHFKSKSNLFDIVIANVIKGFTLSILDVFKSNLSLENKTRILIEKEYDFLTKHPDVPNFIINELGKKDKSFFDCLDVANEFIEAKIFEQVENAQKNGELRNIDLVSIMLLIMSNCHFPFMAKPMIQTIHSLEDSKYQEQLTLHKQYVTEMLINYLFPKK
ncbi:MAG: TetR/AcrR family transcriptional regulator [Flavobacteriia bacterium]|nr:TetR/AcrR family transcriptional regulator [Flavobacteriia bacterium]